MLIKVDLSSDRSIYSQITDSVRAQIAGGDIAPGDRLPSARDLANQLDVNLHTVLKAYQELRDEGVIDLRRGRGAIVTQHANALGNLSASVEDLVELAGSLGVSGEALVSLVRAQLAKN